MSNQGSKRAVSVVRAHLLIALAILASICAGCEATSYDMDDDPTRVVTADKIRQRTQVTAGNVARSVPDIRSFTQGETWTALSGAMGGFLGAFDSVPLFPSRAGVAAAPPPGCLQDEMGPDGNCIFNPRVVLLELATFLEQRLFSDDHLEASHRRGATFLLRGASLCAGMQPCTDATAGACSEPNASCIQSVDAAQIRLRATLVGSDGLDVALLVGPTRANPLLLELRRKSVAVELDLRNTKLALDHLQAVAGSGEAEIGLARGKIRLVFTSAGPDDIGFVASIPEAIQFQLQVPQGAIELNVDDRVPALELHANGVRKTLSIAVDNGAVDLSVPYAFLTDGKGTGTLALHLSGQTWRMQAVDDQKTLTLTDVSWHEPSTLAKDGVPIFALDINPNAGRNFDLSLTPAEAPGGILFKVQPELHVAAECNLQVIAPEFADIPAGLRGMKYEIALRGAGEASVLPITDRASASQGSLKVVTGELSLLATGGNALVTRAGQCLKVVETTAQQYAFELDGCP